MVKMVQFSFTQYTHFPLPPGLMILIQFCLMFSALKGAARNLFLQLNRALTHVGVAGYEEPPVARSRTLLGSRLPSLLGAQLETPLEGVSGC